jgi:voltage-gated potassium channel
MQNATIHPNLQAGDGVIRGDSSIGRTQMSFLKEMSKQTILASEKINFIKETTNQLELEKEESQVEKFRLTTKKFLSTNPIGVLYSNALLVISVASSLQYIYQTYLSPINSTQVTIISYFDMIEIILAVLFMFDWCLSFFIADHKISFVTSFYSMVDLLTVIPIWITKYGLTCFTFSEIHSFFDFVIYVICGLKTTRILRALRIKRKLNKIEDDIERCLGEIALIITVMILFNSAVMQYLEEEVQVLPFHTWMYYIWITIATVGYGDIAPYSPLGRAGAMIMICVAIVSIPKMTNELIEKMALQSVYQRAVFLPKSKKNEHIVICGDMGSVMLVEFFAELFHEDHENENLHVVILQPIAPSISWINHILEHPVYALSVTYLEGTALLEKDLHRAKVATSQAVLIMTNKFGENPDDEDAKTILNQASIKRHISSERLANEKAIKNDPLLCMQLHRPENKRHLNFDNPEKNMVLCLNEIKLGVIARNVLYPGISTLIVNLLTSFADDNDNDDHADNKNDDAGVENLDEDGAGHWDGEYSKGCGWEIYTPELSPVFENAKFATLSEMLYQKLGIVLFALEIEDLEKDKSHMKLLICPGDFTIPSQDRFRIEAFVIARNKKESDLAFANEDESGDDNKSGANNSSAHEYFNKPMSTLKIDLNAGHSLSKTDSQTISVLGGKKEFAWQSLMRKFESSSSKTVSIQEEKQRREEAELRENYFIRSEPCDLDIATIKNSVNDEIPHIDKPLCGAESMYLRLL